MIAERGSGDGGNRTHVRGRVRNSFYERSRGSGSRSSVAAPAGFRGASLLKSPRAVRGPRRGLSPFSDAGKPSHGPSWDRHLTRLVVARQRGRTCDRPHLWFSRLFYEAYRGPRLATVPTVRPRRSLSSPWVCASSLAAEIACDGGRRTQSG